MDDGEPGPGDPGYIDDAELQHILAALQHNLEDVEVCRRFVSNKQQLIIIHFKIVRGLITAQCLCSMIC